MKNTKREFKKSDPIYVVDYWATKNGTVAFMTRAYIAEVDEKKRIVGVILYGDTYQNYRFEDYGRLIFGTAKEAMEEANKLPSPGTLVYQKIGNRVYKKTVDSVRGEHINNVYDLKLCFKKGKSISTKEIGVTIFLDEASARNK